MGYSKEECIQELQELSEKLDRSPEVSDYREHDCTPSVKTLENKFGTWNEAKKASGLDITPHGMNNTIDAALLEMRKYPPRMKTNERGYEFCRVEIYGKRKKIYIHRLLAVAEYGYDEVVDKDDVHHRNEIPWDNRPENIVPMTRSEHLKRHAE